MTWMWEGHPVHLEVHGQGPLTLIAIHGMAADHRLLEGAMEPVLADREDVRRVYLDLPGMGESPATEEAASADGLVSMIVSLARELAGPMALVGQSYGGYLARGVLVELRRRGVEVAGLCLLCPVIVVEAEGRDVDERTGEFWDEGFLSTLGEEERRRFLRNDVRADRETWGRFSREVLPAIALADRPFVARLRRHYGLSADPDRALLAEPFGGPALVLCGRQDPVVGCRDAWRLEPALPHGTFVMVDGAGHDLQLERPELFSACLDQWVGRLTGRP